VAAVRLSVPVPLFRRNQGAILEQQAILAGAGATEEQARLRVALEVRAAHAAWTQARALRPADRSRLWKRAWRPTPRPCATPTCAGRCPLPAALASLREVFGARRTVADARAEVALATLDLLTASGAAPTPEDGR
jgi:outer membrane protein TolC